jgi:electron transfer flavoprotein alpha subunit
MTVVLVFIESREGRIRKPSLEALSIGRKLGEEVAGFTTDRAVAEEAGRHGVKRLYVSNAGAYATEPYTAAMQQAVEQSKAQVVLLGGTSNGRDLAPRLAARLNAGVASDVDRLEMSGGKLRARRPVYSGKAFATVEVSSSPAIATTRPNAFPVEEAGGGAPEVVEVNASTESKAKLLETKTPEAGEMSIAEAGIIVSGGRGLKEAANFSIIRDLAHAIGGAVGASRATVDAGWIDHQHQVGQTGRVVSPNLYIAAGVSGAIQHLAGMSSSKHIIAINKDPEAPIFRIADLGVVGDLFQIVPALTEEVKKARAH